MNRGSTRVNTVDGRDHGPGSVRHCECRGGRARLPVQDGRVFTVQLCASRDGKSVGGDITGEQSKGASSGGCSHWIQ